MTRQHAPAVFGDELPHGDAGRREVDAGFRDAPGNGERAQSLAPVPALAGKPAGAALQNVADPVQRLHVVLERWATEQPDLCHIGRTEPGHAALALDRLDHRRLFPADVCASAAAELDL